MGLFDFGVEYLNNLTKHSRIQSINFFLCGIIISEQAQKNSLCKMKSDKEASCALVVVSKQQDTLQLVVPPVQFQDLPNSLDTEGDKEKTEWINWFCGTNESESNLNVSKTRYQLRLSIQSFGVKKNVGTGTETKIERDADQFHEHLLSLPLMDMQRMQEIKRESENDEKKIKLETSGRDIETISPAFEWQQKRLRELVPHLLSLFTSSTSQPMCMSVMGLVPIPIPALSMSIPFSSYLTILVSPTEVKVNHSRLNSDNAKSDLPFTLHFSLCVLRSVWDSFTCSSQFAFHLICLANDAVGHCIDYWKSNSNVILVPSSPVVLLVSFFFFFFFLIPI
ncbi:hypothetical protein RFI_05802 [Reticulomyxa filosa]|uniref:Uncharacterized protein n=1 Tax=Reticulomyxa filosa TaxID=46433 RepID=X6NYC1_RETFI|nr:hypothetical protein RFI_05802 [Reticulomyxa filosa]|eukprot:ETO31320.1 hypothetical protein RFI_05802 [Reticulomyxa filosa]